MMSDTNSRLTIAGILGNWLKTGDFPNRMIEDETQSRAFITEIVYGAVKQKRALLWIADRLSPRKPNPEALPFLLTGLYQIFFMDNVPDFASVNETVEASKSASNRISGYINGVLRSALRKKEELTAEMATLPVAVRLSHPDMLVERWTKTFGKIKTEQLCAWNNSRPLMVIHPNHNRKSFKRYITGLEEAGIKHEIVSEENRCIAVHGISFTDLPGFEEGTITAHDPSTFEAVSLMLISKGMNVLDACASPGGKSILMSEILNGTGSITAMDVHADRIELLKDNFKRVKAENINVVSGDASNVHDLKKIAPAEGFDRILLDVPCSNTGVLRRRPDARWRFSEKRLKPLVGLQRSILDNTSRFLKPDGLLVYSTCSIEPEENKLLVTGWLNDNRNFKSVKTSFNFPSDNNSDGAFACALKRLE